MFENMRPTVLHVPGFLARLHSTLLCALYVAGNLLPKFEFLHHVQYIFLRA